MIDQEILCMLMELPKKKYIKKALEVGACLSMSHNVISEDFSNPIIEVLKENLQLSSDQFHRLLLALSAVVNSACDVDFNFQQSPIFSNSFDADLAALIYSTLDSLKQSIQTQIKSKSQPGRKLVDIDWKLELQVATEKGKTNKPQILLQIDSSGDGTLSRDKICMNGEQFIVFSQQLKKIKEQLSKLVEQV